MGLNELKLLFSWIYVTGTLPHSIVVHQNTYKIKRFNVGWGYGETWWFGIVGICQLIWTPLWTTIVLRDLFYLEESPIYLTVLAIWQTSYAIVKCIPLFLVFHASRLKTVLTTIGKVDQELALNLIRKPSTVNRRILIGILIGCFWVTKILFKLFILTMIGVSFSIACRCSVNWLINVHGSSKGIIRLHHCHNRQHFFGNSTQNTNGRLVFGFSCGLLLYRAAYL